MLHTTTFKVHGMLDFLLLTLTLTLSFGEEDPQIKNWGLLSNCTLSHGFLWGLHEGCLVLTLQMTPNQKPQRSFFWLMKYALDSNHSLVDR